jgi:uncharacterized protein (DUF3084 family)
MTILVPLILALVAMAAAIAYTGDWLGSLVGKKRLSLFGVRPKQTGRIIGVLAGIAIMLVTVGTLALVFRNAVRVIFNAQAVAEQLQVAEAQTRNLESQRDALSGELQAARETIATALSEAERATLERDQAARDLEALQEQQAALQDRIGGLQGEVESLEDQLQAARSGLETAQRDQAEAEAARDETQAALEATRADLTDVQALLEGLRTRADELGRQNSELTVRNDELLRTNGVLEQSNEALREDITAKNQQLAQLATEVDNLLRDLEDSALALQEAEYRLAAMDSGDLTYSRFELVAVGVLRGQDATTIRDELAQLLSQANENTARRRASRVELLPEQLESLIREALETPGEDIVTLRSAANHFGTEAIRVEVESSENRKLVTEGQLVTSRQLHLGTRLVPAEREQVRTTLLRMQREARDRLLGMGLSDAVSPVLGPDSLELDGFTNQLLRLSGPVTVGLSASVDIYSGGPATLEFVIIN